MGAHVKLQRYSDSDFCNSIERYISMGLNNHRPDQYQCPEKLQPIPNHPSDIGFCKFIIHEAKQEINPDHGRHH